MTETPGSATTSTKLEWIAKQARGVHLYAPLREWARSTPPNGRIAASTPYAPPPPERLVRERRVPPSSHSSSKQQERHPSGSPLTDCPL